MYPTKKIKEIIDNGPIYRADYYIKTIAATPVVPLIPNGDLNTKNAQDYYSNRRDNANYR